MTFNRKNIFLLDSVGALISAVATGLVLPLFHSFTGISYAVTTIMGSVALLFSVYSFCCYYFSKNHKAWMLAAIIKANLYYCLLAIVICFIFEDITVWGQAYFISEALIIAAIVYIEVKVYLASFKASAKHSYKC